MATPTSNLLEEKVIRSSPLLWILAALLCGLLSSLGTQALSDIADLVRPPDEAALREKHLGALDAERQKLDVAVNPRREALARAEEDLGSYERALSTAEANFRTWLETRATLGKAADEDTQIRGRRDQLEQLRHERDLAAAHAAELRSQPDPIAEQRAALDAREAEAQRAFDDELASATRVWTAKVLAARLALVLPLWILGIWLWRTRRQSRYVTLLWGYWAFCVWMLFWGVEPYLPHYGGYARLSMAIALVMWASVSLVRWFNRRAGARRQRIVEKAIGKHRCPGCERSYLVGRETSLDVGLARKATQRHFDALALRPRACPFCGVRLFGACASCGSEQPVHLDHCAACDAPWSERPLTPNAPAAT